MISKKVFIGALASCIEPVMKEPEREGLKEIIKELKEGDDTQWAVGETLQRIIHLKGSLSEEHFDDYCKIVENYYRGR